ncbi:hypothetical protein E0J20_09195 [Rhizobium leguminosarum bv. viciae]|nr:hypothetical protein E0J20_09195 [Rhizobium leguminosarum bv. viciae]
MATKTAAQPSVKKRLIFIVNNKGGVGKSVIARALADLYRHLKMSVAIYDADGGTGTLLISYGTRDGNKGLLKEQDPLTGVAYFDIRSDSQRSQLLDNIENGADTILVDMAGGSLTEITRIVDDGDGVSGFLSAVESQGYRLTLLHAISNVQAATQSVRDYLNVFGDKADHIAVVNKAWGTKDEDFPFWYGFEDSNGVKKGGKAKSDLEAIGGKEIHFPALHPGIFAKLDAANLPFRQAVDSSDMTLTDRTRLNKFIENADAAFKSVGDKLGL